MAKSRTVYRCHECGGEEPKWAGRCPSCEAWNSLVEELERAAPTPTPVTGRALPSAGVPTRIAEVATDAWAPMPTGLGELDRVLQGGLVPGSVTLVGGEPGIGKSTLLLQALVGLAQLGHRSLYVTAEESAEQVRLRAERLGALADELWLVADTQLPHIIGHLDSVAPAVVVIDSIQTVSEPQLSSAPGSVAQVRECAHRLVREAKDRGAAVLLVGHVTKDGGLAGPRALEHLVDTVLSFEGERHHALRMLRAVKHRFGSTEGLGLFAMTDAGLEGVPDPSALFLADRRPGCSGSVIAPVLDGHRSLLVEVQALVTPSPLPSPRRSAQGLDSGRLALVLAVLGDRAELHLGGYDVHTVVAGGVKAIEPGVDLAVALALVSAHRKVALRPDVVVCGEIGLSGELRQVHQTQRRLAEAARLGFRTAIVPVSAPATAPGLDVVRAATLNEAIDLAGLHSTGGSGAYIDVDQAATVPARRPNLEAVPN